MLKKKHAKTSTGHTFVPGTAPVPPSILYKVREGNPRARVPAELLDAAWRMGGGVKGDEQAVAAGFAQLATMLRSADWRAEMLSHIGMAIDSARVKNQDAAEAMKLLPLILARVYDRQINPARFSNILAYILEYGDETVIHRRNGRC